MGVFILFIVIAFIINTVFNFLLRKQVLDAGPIDDNTLEFLKSLAYPGPEPLKWGIILVFGGIGWVATEFLPIRHVKMPFIFIGIEAIFLGLGFLTYHLIARKKKS